MHEFRVKVGPAAFRIGSAWRAPIDQLADLYRDYPQPDFTDFTDSDHLSNQRNLWINIRFKARGQPSNCFTASLRPDTERLRTVSPASSTSMLL